MTCAYVFQLCPMRQVARNPINTIPGLTTYNNYTLPWQLLVHKRSSCLVLISTNRASNNSAQIPAGRVRLNACARRFKSVTRTFLSESLLCRLTRHASHRGTMLTNYLEPPCPILTLGVNPFPYIYIFRTDLLLFLPGVFAPLHQLLHSDPLLLRKRCDLQNNNGEKHGGEFAQHAVHRRNNVSKTKKIWERVDSKI